MYLPKFGSEQAVHICMSKQALKNKTNPQTKPKPTNNNKKTSKQPTNQPYKHPNNR